MMKIRNLIFFTLFSLSPYLTYAFEAYEGIERPELEMTGHERGNGGDQVRDEFIQRGRLILKEYQLRITNVLQKVEHENLVDVLTVKRIKISSKEIYDFEGSRVSAIENNGMLTLYVGGDPEELSWSNILKNNQKSLKLILHEILRASGVNDDDYFYSSKIIKNNKVLMLSYDTELPPSVIPFTAQEIIQFGIRKQRPLTFNHCGKAYAYEYYINGNISCSELNNQTSCFVHDVFSNKFIMSFNIHQASEIINFIQEHATKVQLKCEYSAEQYIFCSNGEKFFQNKTLCQMKFPEHFDGDGERLSREKGRQQQQQQQKKEKMHTGQKE